MSMFDVKVTISGKIVAAFHDFQMILCAFQGLSDGKQCIWDVLHASEVILLVLWELCGNSAGTLWELSSNSPETPKAKTHSLRKVWRVMARRMSGCRNGKVITKHRK